MAPQAAPRTQAPRRRGHARVRAGAAPRRAPRAGAGGERAVDRGHRRRAGRAARDARRAARGRRAHLPAAPGGGGPRARAARAGGAARRAGADRRRPACGDAVRGRGARRLLRARRRPRRGGAQRQADRDRPHARGISGQARAPRLTDGRRARGRRGVVGPGQGARGHGEDQHGGMRRDDGGTGAVRVALAEDGALFREGLQMLLQAAGHEVVAVAAGGDELRELLATTPADVAVLDIRMPPEPDGGLTTAERLREVNPEMGLLFLSHYAESHYLMRILRIGTESIGYRLKEKVGSVEALSDTLARIEAGEIVIEPVLAKRLVDRPGAQRKDAVATLSERELDVLRLMAEGRSNGGIAAQLFVSAKAVEKHIASIFTKLDLHPDASVNHRRVLAVLRYLRSQRDED